MGIVDKPVEGLARIEWKPNGDGDIFFGDKKFDMEKSLSEEPDRKWAARLLKEINTAHASIVKPLREKAEKYDDDVSSLMEDKREAEKDRDAYKEKAEKLLAEDSSLSCADAIKYKADADRLANALRSVEHDRPSVHTDAVWIEMHDALAAHEALKGEKLKGGAL